MLPGKLSIAILEEDDAEKSYFRVKPLLLKEEDHYSVIDPAPDYPEDGCLRIVPDKNESSHFKTRMRRIGLFCILDLFDHPEENDKIRPNKNYETSEEEKNAFIIYSDVIREPVNGLIMEVLPEPPKADTQIHTSHFLIEGNPHVHLRNPESPESYETLEENIVDLPRFRFDLEGFSGKTLHFVVRAPESVPSLMNADSVSGSEKNSRTAGTLPEEAPAPEKTPASEKAPAPKIAEAAESKPETPAAPNPRSKGAGDFPDSGIARRPRSLQEVIEERWRMSRMDQLGHPVPPSVTGSPVESPLDTALTALQHAWDHPSLRDRLLSRLSEIEDFTSALTHTYALRMDTLSRQDMIALEEERLKALSELDQLKRDTAQIRNALKAEIIQEARQELSEIREETEKVQEQYTTYSKNVDQLKGIIQDVWKALGSLSRSSDESVPASPELTAKDWMDRMQLALRTEGLRCDAKAAANLLVCSALTRSLILTGPVNACTDLYGKAIANALGATRSGHLIEISGPYPFLPGHILLGPDTSAVLLFTDANNSAYGSSSFVLSENESLLRIYCLNNDLASHPVPASAYEHCFTIALEPVSAQSEWIPGGHAEDLLSPVALRTVSSVLPAQTAPLGESVTRRMEHIRLELDHSGVTISQRCLTMMWRYINAMTALEVMTEEEAFDYAFAQKALPCIVAEAPLECLIHLRELLEDMPVSLSVINHPLPVQI